MEPYGPSPDRDQHERAATAIRHLAEQVPEDLARWILSARADARVRWEVLEARSVGSRMAGPAYVVPARRDPSVVEAMARAVFDPAQPDATGAATSDGGWRVVEFDFAEAQRQSILRGGHEVSLWVRAKSSRRRKPTEFLVGIALPDGDDDGGETPWRMVSKLSWYLQASEALAKTSPSGARPAMDLVALYLWPGTGLRDPQENCSVHRGPRALPGFLAGFTQVKPSDASRRRTNTDRLRFHQRCDASRREAATRRTKEMGNSGLTDAELAALVPDIDIEQDEVSLQLLYPIVRLWDQRFDALLSTLPTSCLGLSLFGVRPADVSVEEAVRRGGWALRKAPTSHRAEAASLFVEFAGVHLEPAVARKILGGLKLL